MSFVLGFVTGMTTGEAVQRRKGQSQLREYMEKRGYTIVDRQGRPVPFDSAMEDALQFPAKNGSYLVIGAVLVAAVVLTGGSVAAVLAVA
jgi:hypothetical protein